MTPISEPYPVREIQREWALDSEALGSKEKFWYREDAQQARWLFKYPRPNTGEHWAEKIAAEIAAALGIVHARVELACYDGFFGSTTESFARDGRALLHGNQILARKINAYDPDARFRHADHTLDNIWLALQLGFKKPEGALKAKRQLAEYLILDALIGNTDRHHENWGLLIQRVGERSNATLAPSFDHASSLGRELTDAGRQRRLNENQIGDDYVEKKAKGGIYWSTEDRHGISPLELVRRGAAHWPGIFQPALQKVHALEWNALEESVARIPAEWMTETARAFALALLRYTMDELRSIEQ